MNAFQKIKNLFHKRLWVYCVYKPIYNDNGEVIETVHNVTLHFIEPFSSYRKANKAIKQAKYFQPWQEFLIISGK